ncbi:MAG: hypothetical protein IIX79_01950 [Alistipes sp.]|jgi:hypothetical protein|nr:hypothetical protein [Alistipes sp.]MBQ1981061.1 hypothetical protein [Alistipes sp.]MBQ5913777.1 hypothetical protein [Alistipes sp.]
MDPQIVKNVVDEIINVKIESLKARGIIVANYDELLSYLLQAGYTEQEVQEAIVKLTREKQIKCGKFTNGKGWIRDYRTIDRENDLRP